MPTPFSHLHLAQRLLHDAHLPDPVREYLCAEESAFLLGSVAADARMNGQSREDTHFYSYERPITERPWRAMFNEYGALRAASSHAHRAFLAAYVAHLGMDAVWTRHMLAPHFGGRDWGTRESRFLMLHIILTVMDVRDHARLNGAAETLRRAEPDGWLPFLDDATLREWRDFIAGQLPPHGESKTLEVFGARVNQPPAALQAILDDAPLLRRDLWANISPETLGNVEARMYLNARAQMLTYLREYVGELSTVF